MIKKSSSIFCFAAIVLVAGTLSSAILAVQNSQATASGAPADGFLVKGVALDAKGPMDKMVLIVFPIEAKTGKAVTRQPSNHATLSIDEVKDVATNELLPSAGPSLGRM